MSPGTGAYLATAVRGKSQTSSSTSCERWIGVWAMDTLLCHSTTGSARRGAPQRRRNPRLALRWRDCVGAGRSPSRLAMSPRPGFHGQPIKEILLVLARRRRRVQTDQIRRGEGTTVQFGGQAPPQAVWRNLRSMGQQGLALDLAVRPDIECYCRGLRAGATGPLPRPWAPADIEAGGLELGPQSLPLAVIDLGNGVELARLPHGAGLRIRPRIPGGMERFETHLVAHDVVRVGIATPWRFGDDHVGAQHANNPHQPPRRLSWVSLDERLQVLIGGRPRHPRIPVAEQP